MDDIKRNITVGAVSEFLWLRLNPGQGCLRFTSYK